MYVTDYELFEVPSRWLFLKLETETGLVGWGEPTLEGHVKTVASAVERVLRNYLIGKDPLEIEKHWQAMYRGGGYRGGAVLQTAIGGIDEALWDIKGKHYEAPVYELLGGRARDRVRVYQWVGGETPEAVARAASEAVDDGYRTVKLSPVSKTNWIETPAAVGDVVEKVAAVREAVGESIDVCVDFRGRASKAMAEWLAEAVDPHDPAFIEEPVLPEHNAALATIAARTKTPLATGQRMHSRWEFESLLDTGAIDVVQPNPSHVGGIAEAKRIAATAETHDVSVAPSCPIGPIALAASARVDIAAHNVFVQSQELDVHDPTDSDLLAYLTDPAAFAYDDGSISPPEGPGLGIDVDEGYVREQADAEIDWQNPIWYREDDSVAEW